MDTVNLKIQDFMKLYKPVQHRLSAYCRVVTGDEEKAHDLIQETLAAAFENFGKLRKKDSFHFYLFSIARNCHLKHQRRWKFFGKQTEIKPVNIEITPESIEMGYDIELIHKSIAKLNSEQREVILMFHIMGFPIYDIAQNINISEAAVRNRLARGRENLKKLILDKESAMIGSVSANNFNSFKK